MIKNVSRENCQRRHNLPTFGIIGGIAWNCIFIFFLWTSLSKSSCHKKNKRCVKGTYQKWFLLLWKVKFACLLNYWKFWKLMAMFRLLFSGRGAQVSGKFLRPFIGEWVNFWALVGQNTDPPDGGGVVGGCRDPEVPRSPGSVKRKPGHVIIIVKWA